MKKLFVETYGCQMNVRDAEEVTGLLLKQGYVRTEVDQDADVILYNTCSVREHAEDRVWSNVGKLRLMKAARPNLIIGVMGCMAKAQKGKIFKRMPHVDFISGPAQLYEVPGIVENIQRSRDGKQAAEAGGGCEAVGTIEKPAAIEEKRRSEFKTVDYHTSSIQAFITIMEGCDKVCSYCIIPYTRGPEVSRPPEQIVEEAKRLAQAGYKEVMLLGQNVNSYGKRMNGGGTGVTFSKLLEQVNEIDGIERIRFITSHPWDAVEDLFEAMRTLPKVCEHLHLPVQSGSDAVLSRMRRNYTAKDYLGKLALLRSKVPHAVVTTDIIVGFPGETDADFEATLDLVRAARFDGAYMFKYSPRPYAAASRWEDDVPEKVKDQRLQTLLSLQDRITKEESQKYLFMEVEAMAEEDGMGRARTNRKVYFDGESEPGQLVRVRVEAIRGNSLIGSRI